MSEQDSSLYIVIFPEGATQAQVEEINQLTAELGRILEGQSDAVRSVTYVEREKLPQGAKVAELIFAQQAIIQLIPIITPWVLSKVDAIIKSLSSAGKRINANIQAGSRVFQISPKTTKSDLATIQQHLKAEKEIAPSRRFALIVGNSEYQDERLADLQSSLVDAERLAEVLTDSQIGAFTNVDVLLNKNSEVIEQSIEKFFRNRAREDLLLLYFSGHGVRSQSGHLFLAGQNTNYDLLRSTGVSSNFIKENMDESFSQRQILILDCCYGGAIIAGAKGESVIGQTADAISLFQTSGFGRIIITASDAMQYAFDGKNIKGHIENSAFTHFLIQGLQSGEADTDKDGLVDINELYLYAHRNVVPTQNPIFSSTAQEGRLFIGLNPNPTIEQAQLPEQIARAMQSENRVHRQGAIRELAVLLKSEDPSVSLSAENALLKMTHDDSKSVGDYAREVLDRYQHPKFDASELLSQPVEEKQPPEPQLTKSTLPAQHVQAPVQPPQAQVFQGKTTSFPKPQKNVNLGGCFNVIIPGLAYMSTGRWLRGIVTLIGSLGLVAVLLGALISLSDLSVLLCALLVSLGVVAYLFFTGRKAFIEDNNKSRS